MASSESSGPRGGDLLSNSAGGGGVNGDVDPEARQQEVMAVLSAFRSMGSKEVRMPTVLYCVVTYSRSHTLRFTEKKRGLLI